MELKEVSTALDENKRIFEEGLTEMRNEVDRLNRHMERLGRIPALGGDGFGGEKDEHSELFLKWVRQPLDTAVKIALEEKAVSIGDNNAGGYAVPEILFNQVHQKLRDLSPIRQIAHVEMVSSSDWKLLVDVGGTSSGWVGEGGSRSATNTPQLEQVAPTFGTVYAYPSATEESMLDMFFDVQSWLVERIAEELAIQEGIAFISGNGTNKPTGFLNGVPVTTGDADSPARAFGTLQYIPTGVAGAFPVESVDSPASGPGDVLLTTVYTLRPRYRANAVWVMNSTTASVVRKWKDQDGRYLWQESLQMGQPALLLGYPVVMAEDMPDIGSNAFPIAFGDFRSGYVIADQTMLRLTVDDNITTPGQTKFYARKRLGGKVKDDDAIKLIKCATS